MLVDITTDTDLKDHDRIFLASIDNMESEIPSLQQGYRELWDQNWGVYHKKPAAQSDWEQRVSKEK